LPLDTAEQVKERQATVVPTRDQPDSEKIAGATIRALSPIVREVRATLRSHASRFHRAVTRVRITGGTSQIPGLAQHLTRELGVEVDVLSALPPQADALLKSGSEATASLAYGLTLRGYGGGGRASRFNLRRGDLAFKGDFEFLKGRILRLAVAAGVLLVLAAGSSGARIYTLSKRESKLDAALCQSTQRVFGKCIKDFTVALSMLKGQGSAAAVIPQDSAVDLLAELIARTPSDMSVKYDDIVVSLDSIRVRVLAPSFDAPDKIGAALKTFKCFTEVKTGRIQKSRDGNSVEFDLSVAVACPEAGGGQG
jgi:general secretion pathway protein L